ncbi:MAG: hypothetical protein WB471_02145 [Nocardioides sp.]
MRFALRRGTSARDPERLTAVFAGILDGRYLWLGVPARPGRLALRRSETDEIVDHLPLEEVTDQPSYLGARLDLAELDGHEARFDVVLVPPSDGAGDQEPVEIGIPTLAPTPARPSLDGRTLHALARTPSGALLLQTTVVPAAAGLLAVRKLPEAVELTLLDAGPELAILSDDDGVLASWPVDARGVVTITRESIVGLEPITRPAMTGGSGAWRPVRRRANDLLDPRSAALLPQIDHPDADQPLLRLPWSRDALLLVRIFGLGVGGEQA